MLCSEVKDKLYEYIYGELEEEKNKLEEHLSTCSQCQKEYLELRKLLVNDMKDISDLAENIKLPEELSTSIKQNLKIYPKHKNLRYAAAACILIFMFYAVPVAAYYVVENTVLNKYIDFSQGLVKEIEEGKVQLVNKSSTMKDITFLVDGIIRKPDKTTVLFKVKVPKGNKINYAMPSTNSGTKVKINKAFLDLKYVSLTMGVKGKDKLVAVELKKNPADVEPIQKMQGQWLGSRWSYKYNSYGMPYKEDSFIDPLYVICYLSNGEELTFELRDIKNVKSRTECIKVDKVIEDDGVKLTIEDVTRAINYTNVSAKSEGRFGEMEVFIINNGVESEKSNGGWSGGGSTYNYDFSFKPINEGNITIKIKMKNNDKVYYVKVK